MPQIIDRSRYVLVSMRSFYGSRTSRLRAEDGSTWSPRAQGSKLRRAEVEALALGPLAGRGAEHHPENAVARSRHRPRGPAQGVRHVHADAMDADQPVEHDH